MAVTDGDLAIDRELSEVSGLLPLLRYVTPTNAIEARLAFADGGDPVFDYLPVPDLGDTARRLSAVEPDRATDPTVRAMARALKRELEVRLDLLSVRGTSRFFLGSVELFGHVEAPLLQLALDLLRGGTGDAPKETISAKEFAALARVELGRYRDDFPELSSEVLVKDRIAGVMVENGNLYIGSDVRIAVEHVTQLLHHEVGVHVLTYVNGCAQPLHMLAVGLAGHDENQEALGVMSEHLSGGLPRSRLHTLAARVVAAQMRSDDATFRETYERLTESGSSRASAFTTTMRAYRSGGMTKDAVYLRGLVRLCEHLAGGGTLERLFIGKVALEDEPLVSELRERDVLSDPPLRPRFLDIPIARRRLAEIRAGHDVRHIGGIAA